MKSKYLSFIILVLVIAGIILISGCTSEQTQPTESSKCPYEGTYSGLVSGSGEREIDTSVEEEIIETPYIVTYSLEVTFECKDGLTECSFEDLGPQCWQLTPTHAKVSDPFFGCTNGCAIATDIYDTYLEAPIPGERGGNLQILFPNGAVLRAEPLLTDPDAKRISADQSDHYRLIENSMLGFNSKLENSFIETTQCSNCNGIFEQQGFTMTLDKIS